MAASDALVAGGALATWQRQALHDALTGRLIALCFGAGVELTAPAVLAGIQPRRREAGRKSLDQQGPDAAMGDDAYNLLLMKRALARSDAELFGHRARYLARAGVLAGRLLDPQRGSGNVQSGYHPNGTDYRANDREWGHADQG